LIFNLEHACMIHHTRTFNTHGPSNCHLWNI